MNLPFPPDKVQIVKPNFPTKKVQISYVLMGVSFGLALSLVLYIMNYLASSGSVSFISDSFVWLFLLGVISFFWLISYITVGAALPFVVTLNQLNDPSLWGIAISPAVFYSIVFWAVGSLIRFSKN